MTRALSKAGRGGSLTRPERGSSPKRWMLERRSELTNISRLPSREKLIEPLAREGVVTGSGLPRLRPEDSSMPTRQRFIGPPRSLAK